MARFDQEAFEKTLRAASIDVSALELTPEGTLGTSAPTTEVEGGSLPILTDVKEAELVLGRVLGSGGMGVVREGYQASLMRTVAVKTIGGTTSPSSRAAFVREARVAGALEHPNIVPVHALGATSAGEPLIVMKKVDGRNWSELLAASRGRPDHLDRHLDVLLAVLNAVELAHSRGVLHRDLKPDNVLVGAFGEVVVVDWGLAVSIGEPLVPGLARASDVKQIVGTARYMAPEMAFGLGESLGTHTDVYLLGAVLHEILTGQPRHEGANVMALLHHAYASDPIEYDPSVPAELGAIANRATHRDPKMRHPDIPALRSALIEYRRHASSQVVATESHARLTAAQAAGLASEARARALVECRFGFAQALVLWPENARAREGVELTLRYLIEDAIERRDLVAARLLIEEVEQAAWPDLASQADALRVSIVAEESRVRALEVAAHEQDLGVSGRARRFYGFAFAIGFASLNVVLGLLQLRGAVRLTHLHYVIATGGFAAFGLVFVLPRWRILNPNHAARRLALSLFVLLSAEATLLLVLGALGVELHRALAASLIQLGAALIMQSLLIEPRMIWTGFVAGALGALAFAAPSIVFFCVAVAYATFFIAGAILPWESHRAPTA